MWQLSQIPSPGECSLMPTRYCLPRGHICVSRAIESTKEGVLRVNSRKVGSVLLVKITSLCLAPGLACREPIESLHESTVINSISLLFSIPGTGDPEEVEVIMFFLP